MEHLDLEEMVGLVGSDIQVKWHPDYYDNVVSEGMGARYVVVGVSGLVKINEYAIRLKHIPSGSIQERWVDSGGLGVRSGDPMLILANIPGLCNIPAPSSNPFDDKEALKKANSRHNATKCAKCGGLLKEPFPNVKHCPVCEP